MTLAAFPAAKRPTVTTEGWAGFTSREDFFHALRAVLPAFPGKRRVDLEHVGDALRAGEVGPGRGAQGVALVDQVEGRAVGGGGRVGNDR